MIPKDEKMTFQEVGGQWLRVDSRDPAPPTLAEVFNELQIIIDDNTQFCRIIRYYEKYKETITYRAYGGRITINIQYNGYK